MLLILFLIFSWIWTCIRCYLVYLIMVILLSTHKLVFVKRCRSGFKGFSFNKRITWSPLTLNIFLTIFLWIYHNKTLIIITTSTVWRLSWILTSKTNINKRKGMCQTCLTLMNIFLNWLFSTTIWFLKIGITKSIFFKWIKLFNTNLSLLSSKTSDFS